MFPLAIAGDDRDNRGLGGSTVAIRSPRREEFGRNSKGASRRGSVYLMN